MSNFSYRYDRFDDDRQKKKVRNKHGATEAFTELKDTRHEEANEKLRLRLQEKLNNKRDS